METDRIQELYMQWERRMLWPKNNDESHRHLFICQNLTSSWCLCRTRQVEIHEWEDWALDNMDKSLAELAWD